jgi:hypothetical protein
VDSYSGHHHEMISNSLASGVAGYHKPISEQQKVPRDIPKKEPMGSFKEQTSLLIKPRAPARMVSEINSSSVNQQTNYQLFHSNAANFNREYMLTQHFRDDTWKEQPNYFQRAVGSVDHIYN